MRILQVNKFNYLRGGAEKYFLDLCGMLKKEGHEVAKFSMAPPEKSPLPPFNPKSPQVIRRGKFDGAGKGGAEDGHEKYFVSNVNFNKFKISDVFKYVSRILWSFEAARKFEKLILDFRPDIVHLHNIYHQISPSIISVAKKHNLPIVMHLHDYKLVCPNYKLFTKSRPCYKCQGGKYYNCALNRCLKNSFWKSLLATIEMYLHHQILKIYDKVDLFIAPSRFMKDICVQFGVPTEKIRVVYNFVNPPHPPFTKGAKKEDYLLYFGRLSEEKGIDVSVEATRKVDDGVKLKIVGDGPERKNLELRIKNLELEDKVEMPGVKHGDELRNLINSAKAIVIPSIWPENMPLSLLEAMAAGKIVIASRVGGMPEIIKDGENGFLFEARDSNDLADKINKINSLDEKKIDRMAVSANLSTKDFNPRKHLAQIISIYKEYAR
ncbi:glycosyltransferase family 4 protein [Candidatus Falkowbacteria bacterium]|nr:glycosyltransferase family 4 protein [Candidatus Falkowbacteria bacterium]